MRSYFLSIRKLLAVSTQRFNEVGGYNSPPCLLKGARHLNKWGIYTPRYNLNYFLFFTVIVEPLASFSSKKICSNHFT